MKRKTKRKCPVCGSSRTAQSDLGLRCLKCGFENKFKQEILKEDKLNEMESN